MKVLEETHASYPAPQMIDGIPPSSFIGFYNRKRFKPQGAHPYPASRASSPVVEQAQTALVTAARCGSLSFIVDDRSFRSHRRSAISYSSASEVPTGAVGAATGDGHEPNGGLVGAWCSR